MIMCFIEWDLTVFFILTGFSWDLDVFSWYLDVGNGDVDQ